MILPDEIISIIMKYKLSICIFEINKQIINNRCQNNDKFTSIASVTWDSLNTNYHWFCLLCGKQTDWNNLCCC